jgi:integrase
MKRNDTEYNAIIAEVLKPLVPAPVAGVPPNGGILSTAAAASPLAVATINYGNAFGLIGANPPQLPGMPGHALSSITLGQVTKLYFMTHERIALLAPENTKYKTLASLSNERGHMIVWLQLFGDQPVTLLDDKSRAQFIQYRKTMLSKRQYLNQDGSKGKSVEKMALGSTIDLCVVTAVVILKWAFFSGLIPAIPFYYVSRKDKQSKGPKRRELLSVEHVNAILHEANAPVPPGIPALMGENAPRRRKQLQNYLSFLAWAGSRREETTLLKWEYITWPRRDADGKYVFGSDGKPQCGTVFFPKEIQKHSHGYEPKDRWVEFNPQLEALLLEMFSARDPNSEYLFPALKGDDRVRYNKYGEAVERKPYQVRFDTGLSNVLRRLKVPSKDGMKMVTLREYYGQNITLHHFRIYFISEAIMAGVDLKTIAEWAGHKDTTMIEEIYGRVSNIHRAAEALKLRFLPHTLARERSVPQHMDKPLPPAPPQTTP